ncbi:TPA: AAA family ATPase [Legionella pneumophila]|uniref:Uridine kinase n=1 Tax=Legionella pneumophila subsp. pneumophila TaxID=91891 RepID=A0A3A6U3M9_LEGPN|nr:AAA family ATPase [Legionella pneumophila]ERH41697.1 uridine kinase [Legionella pneumophila str. Leg01/11]ERI47512.1 uridine kinase [Legionella pneumophila str. Leg01/20]ANN94717.1 uridine kinase [Legionella pneumophila]ERB42005.1 uridine kinase [Legionella pneumophila str. 121004]MCW8393801.1 AAA family ATPase [Legionella pneumophila]
MTPHIIGISGITGAGKSTLAKALSLDLKATLISWDDFDDISLEPEDYIEWYHKGCNYSEFQREDLAKVLAELKAKREIMHPVLGTLLNPAEYIIFDAPLGKLHVQTGEYIDTCVHIEVPLDISLCRRILRDFKDKLQTKENLLEEISFYLNHSRPLFFDDELKQSATIVIDGLLSTEVQIQIIKNFLIGKQDDKIKKPGYLS